jgi:hypothetical protein
VLRGIAEAINKRAGTLDKAIGDELSKDKAQIDALNKQIADLKSAAEASMNATFRIGIVISLIFIAISVYMTIQGFVSWALTATFTVMLAVLLALMRYEMAQRGAPRRASPRRAALSRASGWGSSASLKALPRCAPACRAAVSRHSAASSTRS